MTCSTTPATSSATQAQDRRRQRVRWWSALALLRSLALQPRRRRRDPADPRRDRRRRSDGRGGRRDRPPGRAGSTPATKGRERRRLLPARSTTTRTPAQALSASGCSALAKRRRTLCGQRRHEAPGRRSSSSKSSSTTASTRSCSAGSSRHRRVRRRTTCAPRLGKQGRGRRRHRPLAPCRPRSAHRRCSAARAACARRHRLPQRRHQPPGRLSTRSSTTTCAGTRPATSSAKVASTASASRATPFASVTFYGVDNQIDGIVLDVLLRKHRAHPQRSSASRSRAADAGKVVDAMLEGVVARGRDDRLHRAAVPVFAEVSKEPEQELLKEWDAASEREKRTRPVCSPSTPSTPTRSRASSPRPRDAIGDVASVERVRQRPRSRRMAVDHPERARRRD